MAAKPRTIDERNAGVMAENAHWITTDEAAEMVGVTYATVVAWIHAGKVEAQKDPSYKRRYIVNRKSVYEYANTSPRLRRKRARREQDEGRYLAVIVHAYNALGPFPTSPVGITADHINILRGLRHTLGECIPDGYND